MAKKGKENKNKWQRKRYLSSDFKAINFVKNVWNFKYFKKIFKRIFLI